MKSMCLVGGMNVTGSRKLPGSRVCAASFNDWLPPVEPWAYMDSFADKDKLTLNW
ncbi:hypothetical protein [Allorhodopirellula heiligendammensis]|uniref:Uncharacterized protein n=1 Tax=Allorhodopirellula heiligendammensis TaxID=2714739 RepID=A0A5C6BTV3_9BACT|nr:hypothetical protein [Allorhodopirellula heiligendammensis]TWU15455.1 hypothetical protein Poly21_26510 [Allorhodopirellula heiligendammensis]